jgi:hypothetical protein
MYQSARSAGDAHEGIVGPFRPVVVGIVALDAEACVGAAVEEWRHLASGRLVLRNVNPSRNHS